MAAGLFASLPVVTKRELNTRSVRYAVMNIPVRSRNWNIPMETGVR